MNKLLPLVAILFLSACDMHVPCPFKGHDNLFLHANGSLNDRENAANKKRLVLQCIELHEDLEDD